MEYRISKFFGRLLLAFSLWLITVNYNNIYIYIIVMYWGVYVLFTCSCSYSFRYQKQGLLFLQFIGLLPLGYRIIERLFYALNNKTLEGPHGEGSPLMFLVGGSTELVLFAILLVSFIEVFSKKNKTIPSQTNQTPSQGG